MVPGMMRLVTRASMRISPAGLLTEHRSPFSIWRGVASAGLIHTCWRAACCSSSMKPNEECVRDLWWKPEQYSGYSSVTEP